jgi:phosphatidyl-myo-inositol dimannoside synthase
LSTSNQILLLTLKVFSATGGIEKVCRIKGKALYEHGLENSLPIKIMSMHDPAEAALNNIYFPAEIFKGYNAAKFSFIKDAVKEGVKSETVILSHINLLLAAWLIKKISPHTKIILLAHGIEVWQPLNARKKMMLASCDKIVSVSSFTKDKIIGLHSIESTKCKVLNNCIDPYLIKPLQKNKNIHLLKRYGFTSNDIILLTLTRLSPKDRYKGYAFILAALETLVIKNTKLKYLLAGGCTADEKQFIDGLIKTYKLEKHVVLTGFIKEEELADHFSLADIYVMPSVKEGFGIVFVEAMYYGVPVIASNADGSTDALLQGKLGLLIEPESTLAVMQAIEKMLNQYENYKPNFDILMQNFGYENYKNKLAHILNFAQVG